MVELRLVYDDARLFLLVSLFAMQLNIIMHTCDMITVLVE